MKYVTTYTLVFALCGITMSHAKAVNDAIPHAAAKSAAGFAPTGWKVIRSKLGDLNGDKRPDLALIIEKQDKNNIIKHDGFGAKELNLNPRYLVVALKTASGYKRHTLNTVLIPSENSKKSTCLIDPLENGGISIRKQSLYIQFHYWLSCGSWEMGYNTMQFKLRNGRFKLIGLEHDSTHRATGDMSSMSVNYLTAKRKQTTGYNISGENEKPKVTWAKLSKRTLYDLSHVTYEQVTKDYQRIVDGSR